MRLVALSRIVQPELLVFEQVAVIGQKSNAARHFQRAFPFELEIPDGVERVGVIARPFQFTADFHRLPLCDLVRYGHRFHRERIGLLDVHVIVTRCERERHGGEQAECQRLEDGYSLVLVVQYVHCPLIFKLLFISFLLSVADTRSSPCNRHRVRNSYRHVRRSVL